MTAQGSRWASQTSGAVSARTFGSTAKSQPPEPSRCLGTVVRGGLSHDRAKVSLVFRVAPQILPRDLSGIEFVQISVGGGRAPIGCQRHLWSPQCNVGGQDVTKVYRTHSWQIRLNAAWAIAVTAPCDAETCSPRCSRVCNSTDFSRNAFPGFRFGGNPEKRLSADPENRRAGIASSRNCGIQCGAPPRRRWR
jgi:hypothetical protein